MSQQLQRHCCQHDHLCDGQYQHNRRPGDQQELLPLFRHEQDVVPGHFFQRTPLTWWKWRIVHYDSRGRRLLPGQIAQEEGPQFAEKDRETEAEGDAWPPAVCSQWWQSQQELDLACYQRVSSGPGGGADGEAAVLIKVRIMDSKIKKTTFLLFFF